MRARAVAVLGALLAIEPAAACTFAPPYTPLSAVPAGTDRTLLVDVIATALDRDGAIAKVRIVRASDHKGLGAIVSVAYLVPPCPDRREPERGDRLAVYLKGKRALGWATPGEAAVFDRRFRPAASPARPTRR